MRRMNKRVFAVLIVLLAIALLGSCNWMLSPFNHMSIDGDRYALDDLYIEYYGTWAEGGAHNLDLVFVSDGLDVSQSGYSGSGEALYIELFSSSWDLESGTYRYSDTYRADTFSYAEAVVGWRVGSGVDEGYVVTSGQVNVRTTLGGGYVIEFDFRALDVFTGSNVDITGRFRGSETDRFNYSMSFSEQPAEQKRMQLR